MDDPPWNQDGVAFLLLNVGFSSIEMKFVMGLAVKELSNVVLRKLGF